MQKLHFEPFSNTIKDKFQEMSKSNHVLVHTDVNVDHIWDLYLSSFPTEVNGIFREKQTYDCNCCKSFIRKIGNVVSIAADGTMTSIWDVKVDGYFQQVADNLSELVKSSSLKDYFLSTESIVGTKFTMDAKENIKWDHLYSPIHSRYVISESNIGSKLSEMRSTKEVFERGLKEFDLGSAQCVLDLIKEGSIYRGDEFKRAVQLFIGAKKQYDEIVDDLDKVKYVFYTASILGVSCRIRNSAIGTLIQDLSNGIDLNRAVDSFEQKVSANTYKRTTALVSQSMIKDAQKTIEALGLEDSLHRRFATSNDIDVTNVLYTSKRTFTQNIFDTLHKATKSKPTKLTNIQEMSIDEFLEDVVPTATEIEVLVENRHKPNFMSLVAPIDKDSPNLFKWDNKISWAYNGDITDTIKERVKQAGGNVEGDLRCSLSWSNYDDLDISIIEPNTNEINYYRRKSIYTKGALDIDMNAGGGTSRTPVENIIYPSKRDMIKGVYSVIVHNFARRETTDVGFNVQIEFDNEIHTYTHERALGDRDRITVVQIEFDGTNFKLLDADSHKIRKESQKVSIWNVMSTSFVPVKMIMNSPNHWGNNNVGNKHTFFILEDCINDEPIRGFFNEFLMSDLEKHRKVFEVLGSKTKSAPTDNEQLSGLGFSESKRNTVMVNVKTNTNNRTYIINF